MMTENTHVRPSPGLRRRVRTTVPDPHAPLVPDLLERDFTANEPNITYVGDIIYLPCGDGRFLYLAAVIDCFSRRLVRGRSPTTCAATWSPTR